MTKPRILLVEDDAELSASYLVRMEAEGFEAKHCDNGDSALQMALEFAPDLILLDIMMPHVDGFDVLDIIRNTKKLAKIKIIVLSALSQPENIKKAQDLGADEYLVKSQTPIADVMAKIRQYLNLTDNPTTPTTPGPQN